MADPRSFHDKAVPFIPGTELKANSCWVAVLKTEHKPTDDGLNAESYLWVKVASRFTGEIIRDQYQKKFNPSEDWILKHEFQLLDLKKPLSDLEVYNDRLIVLEAVASSDNERHVTRRPLKPISNQPLQQPQADKVIPMAHSLKSPSSSTYNKHDENSFSSSAANSFGSRGSSATPQQAPPRPFNPTVNSFERQRSNSAQSPVNATAPAMSRSPAPVSHSGPSPGYLLFKFTYFRYANDQQALAAWSTIPPNDRPVWERHAQQPGITGALPAAPQAHNPSAVKSESASNSPTIKTEPVRKPAKLSESAITEPPLSAEELKELNEHKEQSFQLQNLLKEASPKTLETSVEQGVKILDRIKAPLLVEGVANSPDAEQWIQQIDALRKQAVKTKTIIGVVGNTGAGKSSVINAMLDEERLVPTNCMRACTAVVTEISYNHEEEPYRAQIEFIKLEDWERELKVLFQDLLDSNGTVSRECANEDTDAGIAYAKIKAVYPRKNKEDIANCTIDKLLQEVSHILGTTRNIKETNSMTFYKRLQAFVDSKEKSTGIKEKGKDKDKPKKKEKREMEFWPLIRVVRINVKSPALATGAVIVDLPGVHDANAARAAVAEGYMKQCTGLWIVAPINRAVDDKAAKSLLGESFKRQLKLDGGFSSVTFICSKTDDISLTEAQDSLGLDDEIAPAYEELADLKKNQKAAKKELEELKDSKSMYEEIVTDADEQIEIWEGLSSQLDDGKTVFAPKPKAAAKKRKSSGGSSSRKRRRTDATDTEDSEDHDFEDKDSDDSDSSDDEVDANDANAPLTEEQISAKLQELKSTKKEARNQKNEVLSKMDDVRKVIKEAKRAEDKIENSLSAMCISGRNQYSKGAIQQDFAAGIRELDQEIAAEEDEENFNPDKDVRDYEEVAHSLPVFCVSSRGYQKLCGRLEKDAEVTGFTTKEQTEIPLLQAHCEKLTETGRSANCRAFLNKLSQLLNSMTIWASSDGTGANMTAEQRTREARYLQKGLSGLESGLDKAVQDTAKELQDEFEDNIYDKYEAAVSAANNESINTALHWGLKVNREDRSAGGVHYATYKAICRRQGVFTNAQGPHEWNVQLAEPMIKVIAAGWEKTFSRRIPVVSTAFARNAATRLKTFHRDIEARARKVGAGIAGLSMLSQQVSAYESIFKDLSSTIKETILAQQKEINREFVPIIAQHMEFAYDGCTNESGPGSYARMKALMNGHIANERHTMFQASADRVKISLEQLVKTVEEQLGDKTEEVFVSMRRDYRAVLGAGDVKEGELLPRSQRLCRKEIKSIIGGIQKVFERVVNGELDEDEAQLGEEDELSKKQNEEDKNVDQNATDTDVEGPAADATPLKSEETEHKDEDAVMSDIPAAEQPGAEDEKVEKAAGPDELDFNIKAASNSSVDGEDDKASDGSIANDSPSNQLSQDSPGQGDTSDED